jgi:hypothetical protein
MLHLVEVEDGDRVAVGNLHYDAYEAFEDAGCGRGWSRDGEEQEYEEQG